MGNFMFCTPVQDNYDTINFVRFSHLLLCITETSAVHIIKKLYTSIN